MLTVEPTKEMIEEWKRIYRRNKGKLHPNRKTGLQVDAYFKRKYAFELFESPEKNEVVFLCIMENEYDREKLPIDALPEIQLYKKEDVWVGIDLKSGYFMVESLNEEKMKEIYDDLFLYRGLDQKDLENFFLVAEYVRLQNENN